MAELRDVYLYTVDDLQDVVDEGLRSRREAALQAFLRDAIATGLVTAAQDVSRGGLAVALAESCIGGEKHLGATIDLGVATAARGQ